jgi:hypothetical protein
MTDTGYFVRENTVVFCKENRGDNKKKKENRRKKERKRKKKKSRKKNIKMISVYSTFF